MSFKFPKSSRLLTRRDYRRVSSDSSRIVGRLIIIDFAFGAKSRLGLAASRHFGNAVERNRFKRKVREAFRLNACRLPDGVQLVIRPRKRARRATSCEIAEELLCSIRDCSLSIA